VSRFVVLTACALIVASAALAADSTDPKIRLTKADQTKAAAAVLRFSDLGPAWSGGATKPTSLKAPICPGNQPNDSDLTITGHAESLLSLRSAGLQVDTDAEIFKTPAQVAKLVQRTMGPAVTGCLKVNLLKSIGTGGTIGAARTLTVAKAGSRSALYRVEISVKAPGTKQHVKVFSDYLFVSAARTQFFVNLVAPSSAADALPALENRIAKLLASRAAQ
jgi:hypothetical protein